MRDQERLIRALELLESIVDFDFYIPSGMQDDIREVLGIELEESESPTEGYSGGDPMGGTANQQRQVSEDDYALPRWVSEFCSWNTGRN